MLAWLMPIWSIGAFDSCVHMAEEASNAGSAVPIGIVSSISACWGLGFVFLIVIAACINPDGASVLNTRFGQPMAQVSATYTKPVAVETTSLGAYMNGQPDIL